MKYQATLLQNTFQIIGKAHFSAFQTVGCDRLQIHFASFKLRQKQIFSCQLFH